MGRKKIGRNDPCPCGSGRKYKRCCGSAEGAGVADAIPAGGIHPTTEQLRDLLEDGSFNSLEDMEAELDRAASRVNTTPSDNFRGLSPEQMHGVLYHPFNAPKVARFAERVAMPTKPPVMIIFNAMIEAIGEGGAKATAKGNLPLAVCNPVAEAYRAGVDPDSELIPGVHSAREDDFHSLHVTRLVAAMAELIETHRGRFRLTDKYRSIAAEEGMPRLYPLLAHTFVKKFNWAYSDGYPELPFIQHSFLFTLYLLHLDGEKPRPNTFYRQAYLKAFPALINEAPGNRYSSPEEIVSHCYSVRTLDRFTTFFGLTERRYEREHAARPFDSIVRKTPLLDAWVRFTP